MAILKYNHVDGRKCMYSTVTRKWYHWDHDHEPTPQERMEYVCDLTHGDVSRTHTEPLIDPTTDRGEFGMPTIGGGIMGDQKIEQIDHQTLRIDMEAVPTTPEGHRIIASLPYIIERFIKNNTKYARAQTTDLGAAGIMPDINRKTSVLIDRIWFDAAVVGESTVEVVDDLIGHLLLLRDKLEES